MTPIFEIFNVIGFLFYRSPWSDWPPLSAKKIISLSLAHLVPEIIQPKVGLIFLPKIYYLTLFKLFVSIFSSIFDPITLFFIDLRSLWPLIFTKSWIWLGPICYRVLNPVTENLVKYPFPGSRLKKDHL